MAEETLIEDPVVNEGLRALVDIARSANTADAMEAQAILLRRLALQGDVTGSRVPPPRNITEIGGYLNYLDKLKQPEMRAQALAGILGIAGPVPQLGWHTSVPPLSFVSLAAHRPSGPRQGTIPLAFQVRSDFQPAVTEVLDAVVERGAALPLVASAPPLPVSGAGGAAGSDVLRFLGRVLHVVPATALNDAENDPLLLARPQGSTDPFAVMARVLTPGNVTVPADDWEVLECDATTCAATTIDDTALVALEPLLAQAGFYRPHVVSPDSNQDPDWARFENRTGLVAGLTTLGEELARVYQPAAIAASVFNTRLGDVWNGETFA